MAAQDTTLKIGNCVTFCDTLRGSSQHIGVVIGIREILHISVIEVLWNDGAVTVTSESSLRLL